MKIEVGKFYKTRDGEKRGPMKYDSVFRKPWYANNECWLEDGSSADNSEHDLIAPWTDERRKTENGIHVDDLFKLMECDASRGILTWKPRAPDQFKGGEDCPTKPWVTWNSRYAGTAALNAVDGSGYLHGQVKGQRVVAHRVIWAMAHGVWPTNDIDHIDGNKQNNAVGNLRDVTRAENLRNTPRRKDNSSGITGVRLHKASGRWTAEIQKDGVREHLGYFDTIEEAAAARKVGEVLLGFHPNHGRSPAIPEPVVETVTLHGGIGVSFTSGGRTPFDTHRITFTTNDGEPNCSSIKMERIND